MLSLSLSGLGMRWDGEWKMNRPFFCLLPCCPLSDDAPACPQRYFLLLLVDAVLTISRPSCNTNLSLTLCCPPAHTRQRVTRFFIASPPSFLISLFLRALLSPFWSFSPSHFFLTVTLTNISFSSSHAVRERQLPHRRTPVTASHACETGSRTREIVCLSFCPVLKLLTANRYTYSLTYIHTCSVSGITTNTAASREKRSQVYKHQANREETR